MKRLFILLISLLILICLVFNALSGSETPNFCFNPEKPELNPLFFSRLINALDLNEKPETSFEEAASPEVEVLPLLSELPEDENLIIITEKDIRLKELHIGVNQSVVWKNNQKNLKLLILGIRELSYLDSGPIFPGETFRWTFSQPGEYTYIDGVVLSRFGKVYVYY